MRGKKLGYNRAMHSETSAEKAPRANPFTADDVAAILRDHGWLAEDRVSSFALFASGAVAAGESRVSDLQAWLERAASLLGPQAVEGAADVEAGRARLGDLLSLVFQYDAKTILGSADAHAVLLRSGAREVIRELAHRVLDGPEVDSDRFKEIVAALKEKTGRRGPELFQPIRLALAGRAGGGELDRVILLLDEAAKLPFAARVKGTRERMLEFCAALD